MVAGFGLSRRFCLLCFLTLAIAGPASTQIVGGLNETTQTHMGGNSYVNGVVYWPSGGPVNVRMGIRLRSPTAGEFMTTTDDRGQFIFSGLLAGNYTVVIEGDRDFESVSQPVEVLQSRSTVPLTYSVTIRLAEKAKAKQKPAVVSRANAGVSKKASELYQKGLDLAKTGDYKGAIEQLKQSVAEYPEYVIAFNEMGVQYLRLNQLDSADEALAAALKIDPAAFEPLINRGITIFRLKRYADAEPLLRQAVEKKSDSSIAHYYLGRTLTSLERYDDAEKELNSAVTLGGNEMKEAHRMLATMFIAKGDNKKAVNALEIYLGLVPSASDAAYLRDVIAQLKASDLSPKPL